MSNERINGYRCWMCGNRHTDAKEYLWHIRGCDNNVAARIPGSASRPIFPLLSTAKK